MRLTRDEPLYPNAGAEVEGAGLAPEPAEKAEESEEEAAGRDEAHRRGVDDASGGS